MILDTSAVIEVVDGTPLAARITSAVAAAPRIRMSAATTVELTAVLMRYEREGLHGTVDDLLSAWGVEIVPFDAAQARLAQRAYRTLGRGSGHPARLNLGDCYGYALAIALDEPLLYVGDDFARTDVRSALG